MNPKRATALITGASSGIGLELARIFAREQKDLVIIARSSEKLRQHAADLQQQHNIKVDVLIKDLGNYNTAKEIFDYCTQNNIQVDYLINNAGFGDFGFFAECNWSKQEQMLNVNITALTYLTRLFLPGMILRRSGRIMNLASTAAFQPGPTMSVYYATKAYVLSFTEAISNELKGTGVTATALCPGATLSGFQKASALEESRLVKNKKLPGSKEVAEFGYKAMMKGKVVAIHGFANTILATSVRFMPRPLVRTLVRAIQSKVK